MMLDKLSGVAHEFEFTAADFVCVRELVRRHTGIAIGEGKRDMIYARLAGRLRSLGLTRVADYCAQLRDGGDADELERFRNAVTTNLTGFFREPYHFEFLREHLREVLRSGDRSARCLRIWSAGCSTGEEAYSIAMTLRETIPDIDRWDVRILASDIDSEVLARARRGAYPREAVEGMDRARVRRWFRRGVGHNEGWVRVRPEIARLVEFSAFSLNAAWPSLAPMDAIFCRNVTIYFEPATTRRLLHRFDEVLRPDGLLFVGHSETLKGLHDGFRLLGHTIYQRG